ncbi:MAG: hypothetical protein JWM37_659 [Candidatus Saccharibacteria bacterium]|nr:hypothetical protein [Candidatus Saccharibacteria bacterium]
MNRTARNVITVPAPDRPTRNYLQVVPDLRRKQAIIRPGDSRRKLPQFWDVWVKEALKQLAPPHEVLSYRQVGNFIYVQSSKGLQKALYLATQAAQKVFHIPRPPLIRHRRYEKERYVFHWQLPAGQVKLIQDDEGRPDRLKFAVDVARLDRQLQRIACDLKLPKGCRLSVDAVDADGSTEVHLHIRRNVIERSADLRKLVELHFALALTPRRCTVRRVA